MFKGGGRTAVGHLTGEDCHTGGREGIFIAVTLFLATFVVASMFDLKYDCFRACRVRRVHTVNAATSITVADLSRRRCRRLDQSDLMSMINIDRELNDVSASKVSSTLLDVA